jgi:phosphate transport system substrate-binding protein
MRLFLFSLFFLFSLSFNIYADSIITGAGSSFIAPIMYEWSASYHKETDVKINYQSIGSGAGIKQIENKIVSFGATDMPLKQEDLLKYDLIQFPLASGAIVMVTNIPGITSGQLVLDAKTIAQIYNGEIKKWNDDRIRSLNPKLNLPKLLITVIYRSDGSGTTFNFTSYLDKSASDTWKSGSGTSIAWSKNIIGVGGNGNEGVTSLVKRAIGSIGYVEYAYALQNNLNWSSAKNGVKTVVPETKNWPIMATTYMLMQKKQTDKKSTRELLNFFHFAYTKGAKQAQMLHYQTPSEKDYKEIEKQWTHDIRLLKDNSQIWNN